MKIKNRLFLLSTVMAVMSSSAFANTTGTQTFRANITANTCVVSGLNVTLSMGNILLSALESAPTWQVMAEKHHSFDISNCPQNITKVSITPTYSAGTQSNNILLNRNLGVNAYLAVPGTSGSSLPATSVWASGVKKEFTLTKGGYKVDIPMMLLKNGSAASNGSVSGSSSFTIDFG
ncbi:type 1 fimbrial protein [Salmonella enterica]|nr:type 1 fimbrial protein [Salmonella enterica]